MYCSSGSAARNGTLVQDALSAEGAKANYQIAGLAIASAAGWRRCGRRRRAAPRGCLAGGAGRLAAAALVPGGRAALVALGLGVAVAPALRLWLAGAPGAAGWLAGRRWAGGGGGAAAARSGGPRGCARWNG